MNGIAPWEDADQLLAGHAWPVAHIAGIDMHEGGSGGWIITNTTGLHAQTHFAYFSDWYIGQIKIYCLTFGVSAGFGDATASSAQHAIGGGGSIARDNMDGFFGTGFLVNLPKQVKECGVHLNDFIATPVAQKPVHLAQTICIEFATALVSDCGGFFCVGVIKRK